MWAYLYDENLNLIYGEKDRFGKSLTQLKDIWLYAKAMGNYKLIAMKIPDFVNDEGKQTHYYTVIETVDKKLQFPELLMTAFDLTIKKALELGYTYNNIIYPLTFGEVSSETERTKEKLPIIISLYLTKGKAIITESKAEHPDFNTFIKTITRIQIIYDDLFLLSTKFPLKFYLSKVIPKRGIIFANTQGINLKEIYSQKVMEKAYAVYDAYNQLVDEIERFKSLESFMEEVGILASQFLEKKKAQAQVS